MLYLESFESNEPYLEQSYNEVTGEQYEHLTLRVFTDFSSMLNYYDFVSTQNSGNFSINSFESENSKAFLQTLASQTKVLYNGFLEVKLCKMDDNDFPRTEQVLFVTNPSVN